MSKKQSNERLYRAMSGIGDDIIGESLTYPVQNSRKKHSPLRVCLIAAAVLTVAVLLCTLAVSAAGYDVGVWLESAFGKKSPLLDGITAAPQHIRYGAGCDEIELEVVGVTGDASCLYVWTEVTLPDWFREKYQGDDMILSFCDAYAQIGWFGRVTNRLWMKSCRQLSYDPMTGKARFGVMLDGSTDNIRAAAKGRRLTLTFKGIGLLARNDETASAKSGVWYEHLWVEDYVGGAWDVTFSVNCGQIFRVVTLDTDGLVLSAETPWTVPGKYVPSEENLCESLSPDSLTLTISPLSMVVELTADIGQHQKFYLSGDIQLLMADGSERTVQPDESGSSVVDGRLYQRDEFRYDDILDPSAVVGIRMDGREWPVR